MKTPRLREGKERSLLRKHPWIFEEGDRIDAAFFTARIRSAIEARARLAIESDSLRLVHGESDGLPGLIVDRYGDTLVAQFGSPGCERWKEAIADALLEHTGLQKIYERSDASSRGLEGLDTKVGWLRSQGNTALVLREHGWQLGLDIAQGHKTGYYLDQSDSRLRFAHYVHRLQSQRVLNCFCYTGRFSVAAMTGGAAQVTSIDSSAAERAAFIDADVNASLRRFAKEGRRFDAIVLDPPKLAPTVAHAERAARAYKDINRLALQIL